MPNPQPTKISNPQVRELVAKWLQYVKQNNIQEPEDYQLEEFLISSGYDSGVVKKLVGEMPKIEDPAPDNGEQKDSSEQQSADQTADKKPEPEDGNKSKTFTDTDILRINHIKRLIDKMSPQQRKILKTKLSENKE